jgi:gentisate 1,2-dioxygenase
MSSTAVREASAAATDFSAHACYHSPTNGFAFRWPDVPIRQFVAEKLRAYDAFCPTSAIALDSADVLGTPYPATTPTLLLRYLRLRAGERLTTRWVASSEVYYVLRGAGQSDCGGDSIRWRTGDVFCFPGAGKTEHRSLGEDCLLFACSDEPLLAYMHLLPPPQSQAGFRTTYWPANEIERRFQSDVWVHSIDKFETGQAVQFSSQTLAPSTNTTPTVNAAINTLVVGGDQPPHRHNGVAVTLALQGERVYSQIDDTRVDWIDGVAQITPATRVHSHHNRGSQRARSIIFQDEALHYYTRTPGFSLV